MKRRDIIRDLIAEKKVEKPGLCSSKSILKSVNQIAIKTTPLVILAIFLSLNLSGQHAEVTQPPNHEQDRPEVKWVNPDLPEMPGLSHHTLNSEAMGHDVGYVVWTPPGYDPSARKRYPVIYFLHGMGGTELSDGPGFSEWVSKAIDQKIIPPVICVFPNGGRSGYRDQVEKMITEELIPTVDKNWKTLPNPRSRAIAGYSMGGAGSVYLSIMHPGLFCAAGSMGGGFRNQDGAMDPNVEKALPVWKMNKFRFYLVNGDQDRPEAFRDFSDILSKNNIDHKVVILDDTPHRLGLYYEKASLDMLTFIGKKLRK